MSIDVKFNMDHGEMPGSARIFDLKKSSQGIKISGMKASDQ